MKYYQAVALKRKLMNKLNDGLFVPAEWESAIEKLEKTGFVSMAGNLKDRLCAYRENWRSNL